MKSFLFAVVLLSCVAGLVAQDPVAPTPEKDKAEKSGKPVAERAVAPNPFAPDEVIKNLFGVGRADPMAFQPLVDRPALPDMRLRGIVQIAKRDKPAALVELTGFGSYTVRAGESIAFTVSGTKVLAPPAAGAAPTASVGAPQQSATSLYMSGSQRERAKESGAQPQPASASSPVPAGKPVVSGNNTGVTVREPVPIVLRVERVAKDGVVVEIGTMGQYLVIR